MEKELATGLLLVVVVVMGGVVVKLAGLEVFVETDSVLVSLGAEITDSSVL